MRARLVKLLESKFIKDTLALQASGLLTQISGFLASAVLAFALGAHGQGLFVIAVTLQALLFNVVSVGVIQATVSQVAAASARDLQPKVADWLAFLVKTYVLTSTLMIVLGYWALPALCEYFYADDLPVEEARQLGHWSWWLTWWIAIDTPRAVTQVAFQSTRRMKPLAQLDAAHEFIRLFVTVGGVLITGSPAGAVAGEVASRAFAAYLATNMYNGARHDGGAWLPSWREIFARAPAVPIRQGIRLGLRVGVIKNTTTLVITILPRLLLSGYATFAWVAYFTIAQKVMGIASIAMQGVSRNILPALAEKRGQHDFFGFRKLYWRTTAISGGIVSAAILLGLLVARPMIALAYPADYAEPVFTCCAILALGMIPASFAIAQDPFYILTNRMRPNLIICLVGALVTIPANVWLANVLPLTGPVWGQALYLSWVLVHFGYIAFYFRKADRDPMWSR